MKPYVIIFDIDGTLANSEERAEKFLAGDIKDWDSFYANCDKDECIESTCEFCKILGSSHRVIYLTGRPESIRKQTSFWLVKNLLPNGLLFMRKDGDHRPDYVVKREIYEQEIKDKYDVIGVFEDRDSCVKMWRELGLTCFQVADGSY